MWANIRSCFDAFCTWLEPWARYAYYLRFSILLWALPFLLVWANSPSNVRSLTSGIVTPTTEIQYLCVSFFLIAASFVALILARIVVINGRERFGDRPPVRLRRLLANNRARQEWIAPAASQLNNLFFFIYLVWNGKYEGIAFAVSCWGLAWGILVALAFWYALSAMYYLTYKPHAGVADSMHLAKAAARTLLLPRSWLFLTREGHEQCFGDVLEDTSLPIPVDWIARLFPIRGYRWRRDGALYEGHYFSVLAGVGFIALYWVLWPLTAPILSTRPAIGALAVQVTAGLILYVLVLCARVNGAKEDARTRLYKRNLRIWKAILALPILGYTLSIPCIYFAGDAERFPILALVLILIIGLAWFFGGLAFFADRYRVPVLTVVLVVLLVPRIFHWTGAREEHYFSVKMMEGPADLPTPGQILQQKLAAEKVLEYRSKDRRALPPTLIVVTSTGGGIHAAGWTTAVLKNLEVAFSQNSLTSFHDHVLLLSTVSGGSAGLYAYLRELDPKTNGKGPDWERMEVGARCSSLESIGWGLVYYDIPKAIVPLIPGIKKPSSGVDDLVENPFFKDRTWGLRRAMLRNLNDPYCRMTVAPGPSSKSDVARLLPAIHRSDILNDQQNNPDKDLDLTLSALSAIAPDHPFPAFTMNTTSVEDGARFLLANYKIPRNAPEFEKDSHGVERNISIVPQPADSFLDAYRNLNPAGGTRVADLPLATAAQLSATFPYVSSATTFPEAGSQETAHFVDGGYYDNDGTASAIEFIRTALDESPSAPRIRILLVEIRNSKDEAYGATAAELPKPVEDNAGGGCPPWNLNDQLSAPPKGFYSAGHNSVTDRNRNGLVLLERAYSDRLDLLHFIVDDRANGDDTVACVPVKNPTTDPLNWALTPRQQHEIDNSALRYKDKYAQIANCFATGDSCPEVNAEAFPR